MANLGTKKPHIAVVSWADAEAASSAVVTSESMVDGEVQVRLVNLVELSFKLKEIRWAAIVVVKRIEIARDADTPRSKKSA